MANALLVVPKTRQIFVDLGFAEKAASRFEVCLRKRGGDGGADGGLERKCR